MLVHTQADGDRYAHVRTARHDEILTPGELPEAAVTLADVMPPAM